ncbi:MAG: PD40 domain-containing protein [Thermoguttaceae bacterium]|nr:PD40 domain-containing protein [Thermoguttaceae bacterium]
MKRYGLFSLLLFTILLCSGNTVFSEDINRIIQNDWIRQEETAGRSINSPEALFALKDRAEALLSKLVEEDYVTPKNRESLQKKMDAITPEQVEKMTAEECSDAYLDLRWEMRNVIFDNPLIKDIPIVFMKGDRYIWQLIHEYLSYYYRGTNTTGKGMYCLKNPGRSFETVSLTDGKFPRGVFSTPSLSYDGKTLYFAFADFSKVIPEGTPRTTAGDMARQGHDDHIGEYLQEKEGKFHLFKMDIASGDIEQLTDGPYDDFDPVLLPDGDLIFVSTRRGSFARCTGDWEPVMTATLHRRYQNGDIRCISWHETNEWNPTVLKDGRIVYARWDYVDREAARYMNLWVTNPDGTNAQTLFGNYTEKIVASLQPEEIPDSNKILFLGSGHHIAVGGPLVILDPTKIKYDPETSEDTLDCIDVITPDIPFPETLVPDNPDKAYVSDHYYYGPYPLSEDFYLTSYSHDPNGGYLSVNGYGYTGTCGDGYSAGKLGLYYRDRFGNLELIYEDPETSCRYPLQLTEKSTPRTIASRLPENAPEYGTFVLSNVRESLVPFPEDRPITELRVFQILPKYPGYVSNTPRVGHAHAQNARVYLGSVPVEKDGSAHFRVPACKPLYFQAVDSEGKAVHTMMSEVYLQPGENRGCIGCHEQTQTTQKNVPMQSIAMGRPASELIPGPEGTRPMSYPVLIQPILDRACVSCHDGSENGIAPDLTGESEEEFSRSYNNLEPYLRWYEWLGKTIRRISSLPGECGCDMSPLTVILDDENHLNIGLSPKDRATINFWLDANVPFYGTEDPEDQKRQLNGEIIPIPPVQ